MNLKEGDKERLTAILNDPVFRKATEIVLSEKRIRATSDIDANATAHCFNEGMIQFVEKLNDLVSINQSITPKPRTLR